MPKELIADGVERDDGERKAPPGAPTGQLLIDAFRESPHPEIEIAPERGFLMTVSAAQDFDFPE